MEIFNHESSLPVTPSHCFSELCESQVELLYESQAKLLYESQVKLNSVQADRLEANTRMLFSSGTMKENYALLLP